MRLPRTLACVGLGTALVIAGCGSGAGATAGTGGTTGGAGSGDTASGGAGGAASGAAGSTGTGGAVGSAGTAGGRFGGGAGGTSGGAGDTGAGAAGVGGAGGDVVIIRGDPSHTFVTATFLARGFGAEYEGRLVVVRVGSPDRPPERLVQAWSRFHDGGFEIALPMGVETSLYKAKFLYVDADGDGLCTPENDLGYRDASFLEADLTFVLQGSVPPATGNTERLMLQTTATDLTAPVCDVMNGPWPDN